MGLDGWEQGRRSRDVPPPKIRRVHRQYGALAAGFGFLVQRIGLGQWDGRLPIAG